MPTTTTNYDGYTIQTSPSEEDNSLNIWKVFEGEDNACDPEGEDFVDESAGTFATVEEAIDDAKEYIDELD